MPASNVTRVRRLGFWNSIASVRRSSGGFAWRRSARYSALSSRRAREQQPDLVRRQVGRADEVPSAKAALVMATSVYAEPAISRPSSASRRRRQLAPPAEAKAPREDGASAPGCA